MPIPAGSSGYVWPPTASEVDQELNLGTDTSQDSELAGFIAAAAAMIENVVGPVNSTAYSEVHDGGGATLYLRRIPVLTVVAITDYAGLTGEPLTLQPLGATTDAYGFSLDDPLTGVVTRRTSSGVVAPFIGGRQSVTVTYLAGRTSVPPNVRLAALELVREMWSSTQRGNSSGRPVPAGDMAVSDPVYVTEDLPPMVRRLLLGEKRPTALA